MFERIATARVKLVTIIAASELQDSVIQRLRDAGAAGYTMTSASGGGLHGRRDRSWIDAGNARIECIASAAVAERVLESITQAYPEFVVAFVQDVEAVPREHFIKPPQAPPPR